MVSETNPPPKRLHAVPETEGPARKSERTRTSILEGALALLWTAPFRDVTVSGLMAHVGASRPVFYQYFHDLHELMEELLRRIRGDLIEATRPWFECEHDPLTGLRQSLEDMVTIGYEHGPFIRAVADAATNDERLERAWNGLLEAFDHEVAACIRVHQARGWVPALDADAIAVALNRLDLSMLIHAFGRRPRQDPEAVREALVRIWSATLYPDLA